MIYVTSVLYPLLVEDHAVAPVPQIVSGFLLRMTIEGVSTPVPTITAGALVDAIHYLTYGPGIPFDALQAQVPDILAGALVEVIHYLTYGPTIDAMSAVVPEIVAGTLIVTIAYVNYVNGLTFPDEMLVPTPSITSGSLT